MVKSDESLLFYDVRVLCLFQIICQRLSVLMVYNKHQVLVPFNLLHISSCMIFGHYELKVMVYQAWNESAIHSAPHILFFKFWYFTKNQIMTWGRGFDYIEHCQTETLQ